jgi:hypothetical protein
MMNTFQFISSVGGAGAPEDNKGNEDSRKAQESPTQEFNKTFLTSFPSV